MKETPVKSLQSIVQRMGNVFKMHPKQAPRQEKPFYVPSNSQKTHKFKFPLKKQRQKILI